MRVRLDLTIAEAIEVRRALQDLLNETANYPTYARRRGIMTRAESKVAAALGIHAEAES